MKDVTASFQGQILANGVAMEEMEVAAKNGRIYTLTGVLIPPSILPVLPHRCDDTRREMKQVSNLGEQVRAPKQPPRADNGLALPILQKLTRRVSPQEPRP